jgi:hypothetical protein
MFAKGNSFFSDYTDREGKRHRKAHKTSLAATRHEQQMKRRTAARPAGAGRQRTSSPPLSLNAAARTLPVDATIARSQDVHFTKQSDPLHPKTSRSSKSSEPKPSSTRHDSPASTARRVRGAMKPTNSDGGSKHSKRTARRNSAT